MFLHFLHVLHFPTFLHVSTFSTCFDTFLHVPRFSISFSMFCNFPTCMCLHVSYILLYFPYIFLRFGFMPCGPKSRKQNFRVQGAIYDCVSCLGAQRAANKKHITTKQLDGNGNSEIKIRRKLPANKEEQDAHTCHAMPCHIELQATVPSSAMQIMMRAKTMSIKVYTIEKFTYQT